MLSFLLLLTAQLYNDFSRNAACFLLLLLPVATHCSLPGGRLLLARASLLTEGW